MFASLLQMTHERLKPVVLELVRDFHDGTHASSVPPPRQITTVENPR